MLSVVIPTYNEAANIERLLEELANVLGGIQAEVIVVDDNSPDGTAALAERSGALPVRVIRRAGKLGLASAVVEGVRAAKGADIVVMDADLSHPPAKVPELAAALANAEIVVGSRYVRGGGVTNWPLARRLTSWGATKVARLVFDLDIRDPVSGFFAVRRKLFLDTQVDARGHKILLNLLAKNRQVRVVEIPFVFTNRKVGKSKLGAGEIVNFLRDVSKLLNS